MGTDRIVVVAFAAILGACDSTRHAAAPIDSVAVGCVGEVTVSPPTIKMFIGDTAVVTVRFATCEAKGSSVTWSSSNMAVASVDSATGVVRALAAGQVSVVAKLVSDPTESGSAVVQVNSR